MQAIRRNLVDDGRVVLHAAHAHGIDVGADGSRTSNTRNIASPVLTTRSHMWTKIAAGSWLAVLGMYMVVSRRQLARQLAESGTWGQRNKELAYRRQHRLACVSVPVVGGIFFVVGVAAVLDQVI